MNEKSIFVCRVSNAGGETVATTVGDTHNQAITKAVKAFVGFESVSDLYRAYTVTVERYVKATQQHVGGVW